MESANLGHLPNFCFSSKIRKPDSLALHYFSCINADPDRWDDPRRCWELFHDLNLPRNKQKFGPWAIDLGNGHADGIYASAEWMVPPNGEIIELVPYGYKTWHAGFSSFRGVENCNEFMAGVELIAAPQSGPEYGFTEAQYRATAEIIVTRGFPRERVTTHQRIREEYQHNHPDQNVPDKNDVGPTWSWDRLNHYLDHDLNGG